MSKLIHILGILLIFTVASEGKKKIVCYYPDWSQLREPSIRFDISDINTEICTHLVYVYAGISRTGNVKILKPQIDIENHGYLRFTELGRKSSLPTLIAVGGWEEGSAKFSKVAGNFKRRANFVTNALNFVKQYHFNGLELAWSYPAQRNGSELDKENYVTLLRQLKGTFEKERLILSVSAGVSKYTAQKSYNIPEICKHVDFINFMTYEYHTPYDETETQVGPNSPLFSAPGESDYDKTLNIDFSVQYWISLGAPPEKLILGMAFFGRSYTMTDTKIIGRGAPFKKPGNPGRYTKTEGLLAYFEICSLIQEHNWKVIYDTQQRVPYAYSGNQIVSYDNPESLAVKAQYVLDHNLGGVSVWTVDFGDFKGICGPTYPLLKAIKHILKG